MLRSSNSSVSSFMGADDDLDEWEAAPDPEETVAYGQPLELMEEEKVHLY